MHLQQFPRAVALAVALLAALVAACGVSPPATGGHTGGSAGGATASFGALESGTSAGSTLPAVFATTAGASAAGPAASAGQAPKPVATTKGIGFADSAPFKLKAGSYLVRWTLTSASAVGCSVIGALHSPDGRVSIEVANTTLAGKGSRAGQKTTPRVNAGTYLVTFATTCAWSAQVYLH